MAQRYEEKLYSEEEYLALEAAGREKHEFFRGRLYLMTGASLNHNRITVNLTGLLYRALNGQGCEVFSADMRLLVKANGLYTYPDLMVICGPVELAAGRNDTATNPRLIVEVLSESTAEYDRTDKFELYKGLESLQDYILVDQHRPYIQRFHRLEGEPRLWIVETYQGLEARLDLPPTGGLPGLSLSLGEIYERVEWPSTGPDHPTPAQS